MVYKQNSILSISFILMTHKYKINNRMFYYNINNVYVIYRFSMLYNFFQFTCTFCTITLSVHLFAWFIVAVFQQSNCVMENSHVESSYVVCQM